MDVLNAGFDFNRDAPFNDKKAFSNPPAKNLLWPGTELLRLVSVEDMAKKHKGNELLKSPWWLPRKTFNELNRIAQRLGFSIPEVARAHLAIPEKWNPTLEWLCIIELTRPAWAWQGTIAHQPIDESRKILLLGGLQQTYLPNLFTAVRWGGDFSESAIIVHFGKVP